MRSLTCSTCGSDGWCWCWTFGPENRSASNRRITHEIVPSAEFRNAVPGDFWESVRDFSESVEDARRGKNTTAPNALDPGENKGRGDFMQSVTTGIFPGGHSEKSVPRANYLESIRGCSVGASHASREARIVLEVSEAINAFDGTAPTLANVMHAFRAMGAEPHSTVPTSTGMAPRSIWAAVADAPTVAAALHAHDHEARP